MEALLIFILYSPILPCLWYNISRRRRLKPLAATTLNASLTKLITPDKNIDSTILHKYYAKRYERSKGIYIAV